MKSLEINELKFENTYPEPDEISNRLDSLKTRNRIELLNWNDFVYKPDVAFSMGYTSNEILLKYYIAEEYFKAEKTVSNQKVYEDSCVEFFVSPTGDGVYYNMEFNGIGTCLMGSGTGRENRTSVDPEIISAIRRKTSLGKNPISERKGRFFWTITIAIPLSVFFLHQIKELKGKTFRANFYKCGDLLPVPHYVTWSPVGTPKPNFHQPDFFGVLKFQ